MTPEPENREAQDVSSSKTMTERSELPSLKFYKEFPDDWESFSQKSRQAIVAFLERLQQSPHDPAIMANVQTHGQYYAAKIGPVVVYWALNYEVKPLSFSPGPASISILAIEPTEKVYGTH